MMPEHYQEEIARLVGELIDGQLSEAQIAELLALLECNAAARENYAELITLQAMLETELDPQLPDAVLKEIFSSSAAPHTDPPDEQKKKGRVLSPLLGFLGGLPAAIHPVRHPVWFFIASAALTSVFWMAAVMFIWPRGQVAPGPTSPSSPEAYLFTAQLQYTQPIEWERGSPAVPSGSKLSPGQELKWKSGSLQILFGDGARTAVEGPASLRILSRGGAKLSYGKLLAAVPEPARGFKVETPVIHVVDLGTEFGLEARANETEVQVFEGKVEVQRGDRPLVAERRLVAGQAALFGNSPDNGFYVKEKEMNRAIYLTLAAVLSLPAADVAKGGVISVNFRGFPSSGALVGANTAGFVPVNNWNDITPTMASSATPLIDDAGVLTSVTVSYVGKPGNGSPTTFPGTGDQTLFAGNIYSDDDTPVAVTFGGTIPYAQYDLYVYLDGVGSGTNTQTYSIPAASLSLQAFENMPTGNGSYIQATSSTHGNYVLFSGLDNTKLPSFIFNTVRNSGSPYGYLNGLQIVDTTPPPAPQVPEPTVGALLGVGGMIVLFARRRRRENRVNPAEA